MTYRDLLFLSLIVLLAACSSPQLKGYAFEANSIHLNSSSAQVKKDLGEPMKIISQKGQEQWLYYTMNESFLEATISMGKTEYELLIITIDPKKQIVLNCQYRLLAPPEFDKISQATGSDS